MDTMIQIDETLQAQMLRIDADWSGIANRAFRRQIELLESLIQYDSTNLSRGYVAACDWLSRSPDHDLIGRFVALTGGLNELLTPSEFTIAEKAYVMMHPRGTRGKAKDFWTRVLGDCVPDMKNTGFIVGFVFGVAKARKQKQADDVPNPNQVPEQRCIPLPTGRPLSSGHNDNRETEVDGSLHAGRYDPQPVNAKIILKDPPDRLGIVRLGAGDLSSFSNSTSSL